MFKYYNKKLHKLIGIYYVYDENVSRPVRYNLFSLKILLILSVTTSFLNEVNFLFIFN